MIAGILKEAGNEKRVAMLPGEAGLLVRMGVKVIAEEGAGETAFASDSQYVEAGAAIAGRKEVLTGTDFLLSVNPLPENEIDMLDAGRVVCSSVNPFTAGTWLERD